MVSCKWCGRNRENFYGFIQWLRITENSFDWQILPISISILCYGMERLARAQHAFKIFIYIFCVQHRTHNGDDDDDSHTSTWYVCELIKDVISYVKMGLVFRFVYVCMCVWCVCEGLIALSRNRLESSYRMKRWDSDVAIHVNIEFFGKIDCHLGCSVPNGCPMKESKFSIYLIMYFVMSRDPLKYCFKEQ